MAKNKANRDLVDRLHAGGLRKRTAQLVADATDTKHKPIKQVRSALGGLSDAIADAEDRVKGGPKKRKAAAKKAAATRKKKSVDRSAAGKKGAATRKATSKKAAK